MRDAKDKLEAYCIRLKDNELSVNGFDKLVQSSMRLNNPFKINIFDAITPHNTGTVIWNYPWDGEELCIKSGLMKRAYPTVNPGKRVACFVSHRKLWEKTIELDKPILVLEHDAIFVKPLDLSLLDEPYDIIGINSPVGATRKAQEYDAKVQLGKSNPVVPVPKIDDLFVPQGLAGNSAYIIKPAGAKSLIDKVNELGAWPNDALMCYQNIKRLGVSTTYYTKVQGLPSTTTQ